ncbi:MAG: alginate O-acetyltransferase complex protein AlgI [Crocinitomicaceae bacterium]|jgi:alginate O-acetyltransferase complex protein AlgI
MQFDSIFFLMYLPVVVLGYYLLSHKYRWSWLLFFSYFFYGFWRTDFLVLIFLSTVIDYFTGLKMSRLPDKSDRKKWMVISLLFNLGLLFSFKYLNFLHNWTIDVLNYTGVENQFSDWNILLPIGISFYTFQTLSYSIDMYRGSRKVEKHFGYFALYVSFFPQLVAGPIERSTTLLPQLHVKASFLWENISKGARLIIWGLFKKVVFANYLILWVRPIFSEPDKFHGPDFWLAGLGFIIWIYAEFSAYTDIAIGSARLLNIQLSPNFKRPYFSRSVSEHWQRWHISLTKWINDYLFFPMARKAKSKVASYVVILYVFCLIGLWHGANWTYLFFGCYYGFWIIFYRISKPYRRKFLKKIGIQLNSRGLIFIEILTTFSIWWFSSFLFASPSITNSWYIVTHFFEAGFNFPSLGTFNYTYATIIVIGLIIFVVSDFINKKELENPIDNISNTPIRWGLYYLMIFMLIAFSHQHNVQFFYFQF